MAGFLDIHQHIIYGVDDGAKTYEMSHEMLLDSLKDGVSRVIATPHITPGQDALDMEKYLYRLAQLNAYCGNNDLPIRVYTGSEILYTPGTVRALQAGEALTLAGGPFVLVEFLPDDPYETLEDAARKLTNAGYRPVFAHVERYNCLLRDIRRVKELRGLYDVRMQVNCSTILRNKGFRVRRFMQAMLAKDYIDYVATDAHNRTSRPTQMRDCFDVLDERYGQEYALALTGGRQLEVFSG